MTSSDLPTFRYHPDPVESGSVERSENRCASCQRERGFAYVGPVYAVGGELRDAFCPWCIADGTAATAFDAEFTDVGVGVPDDVPPEVIDQVSRRTPGFSGWQQEHWLYHCGDAAAFMGPAGYDAVTVLPGALKALESEAAQATWGDTETRDNIQALRRDTPPTAYLFRCLHCGMDLAYSDFT